MMFTFEDYKDNVWYELYKANEGYFNIDALSSNFFEIEKLYVKMEKKLMFIEREILHYDNNFRDADTVIENIAKITSTN